MTEGKLVKFSTKNFCLIKSSSLSLIYTDIHLRLFRELVILAW